MSGGEGYDAFFRDEYPRVLRTTQLILQDLSRAEDATQDAFIRLYQHWGRVSKYEMPDAWVRRIAIRIAVRENRREKLRATLLPAHGPTYIDAVYDRDLMKAIAALPGMQRAAVVLFYLEDRRMVEVAQILDCSAATAGVHLHRARKKLARLLGTVPEEEGVTEGVA